MFVVEPEEGRVPSAAAAAERLCHAKSALHFHDGRGSSLAAHRIISRGVAGRPLPLDLFSLCPFPFPLSSLMLSLRFTFRFQFNIFILLFSLSSFPSIYFSNLSLPLSCHVFPLFLGSVPSFSVLSSSYLFALFSLYLFVRLISFISSTHTLNSSRYV